MGKGVARTGTATLQKCQEADKTEKKRERENDGGGIRETQKETTRWGDTKSHARMCE